jgi:hypothetical protein
LPCQRHSSLQVWSSQFQRRDAVYDDSNWSIRIYKLQLSTVVRPNTAMPKKQVFVPRSLDGVNAN